ncbi:hypothetical protein RCL_jg6675.t1 [Rhizophagus clarus]|uniref:Uncharacterized protein n=1 Tax=Rhizophagus clarus TaxID=94130 RepID=A0A8H3LHN8_9GLOM|nr:hypothetical protein RCL_jg6675.t1 [Rhizophagus clarus]
MDAEATNLFHVLYHERIREHNSFNFEYVANLGIWTFCLISLCVTFDSDASLILLGLKVVMKVLDTSFVVKISMC